MRKFIFCCLLIPLFGLSQNKNVLSTFRVFAKPEKNAEFQKALAAHAQKFHSGDWKWRVYEIQTGPDGGGYHIIEGPLSWEQFDKRGDLSTEHTADWDKNVSPLTTGAGTSAYSTFREDLSTVQPTDYADKIVIMRMFPKPGMILQSTELIKKLQKVWTASNESVAVYSVVNSGQPQFVTATRLKSGLKELDPSFRKPMADRFNEVHGANAWVAYLDDYAKAIENRWSEMLFYRADLSSK